MKYKIINPEEDGRCLECGSTISGRPDKKYCNARCKNHHNNRRRDIALRYERLAMSVLWQNHRILEFYLLKGIKGARLEELVELGFEPGAVTGHRRGECGHNEYSCFDISYCQSEKKIFRIRRTPETNLPEKSS